MSKELTAMQELIKSINGWDLFNREAIVGKATELLIKEKEQILNAFVAGDERGIGDIPYNAEQYYTQTYK